MATATSIEQPPKHCKDPRVTDPLIWWKRPEAPNEPRQAGHSITKGETLRPSKPKVKGKRQATANRRSVHELNAAKDPYAPRTGPPGRDPRGGLESRRGERRQRGGTLEAPPP